MRRSWITSVTVCLTIAACWGAEEMPVPPPDSFFVDSVEITAPGVATMTVARAHIHGEFFDSVNVAPMLGRRFIREEYGSQPAVAMLSHRIWQSSFDRRPGIIGESIESGGDTVTIVGILPDGMTTVVDADLWVPGRAAR